MGEVVLRPYQQECVTRIVDQFKAFRAFLSLHSAEEIEASEALQRQMKRLRTALVVLPTAAGKTIVACSAEIEIRKLLEQEGHGLSSLIIAHREELLQQARDKYQMLLDIPVGMVGGGIAEYGHPLTCASIQTISRPKHLKQLRYFNYRFIFCDEYHHSPSSSYVSVFNALPDAFILGVTATPDRLDGKPLVEHSPLFQQSILDMIPAGYLSNLRGIAVGTNVILDGIKRTAGDYNEGELAAIIDTPERNALTAAKYKEHALGRPFICFGVTIAHAEHLAEAFQAAGVRAAVVSGKTPSHLRAKMLADYQAGILDGLFTVGVLTEGTDLPLTSCIILARPTQSRALFTQMAGRGLRLHPGKEDCLILDMTDNVLNHKLEPVNLSTMLGKRIKDDETITEMLEREEEEQEQARKRKEREEKEKRERRIRQKQREQDLIVNLLQRLEWKQNTKGAHVLEVGEHRIGVFPAPENPELWQVGARLATSGLKFQKWRTPMPLHEALQFATQEAERLSHDPGYASLVDEFNPRRQFQVSEKQLAFLDRNGIPYPTDLYGNCLWTRAQASQVIGAKIREFEEQRGKSNMADLATVPQF